MYDDDTIDWNRIDAQRRAELLVQRYGVAGAAEVAEKQASFYRNDPAWGQVWDDTKTALRAWTDAVKV